LLRSKAKTGKTNFGTHSRIPVTSAEYAYLMLALAHPQVGSPSRTLCSGGSVPRYTSHAFSGNTTVAALLRHRRIAREDGTATRATETRKNGKTQQRGAQCP